MFFEAVKVDMANSKEKSFKNTITSTLFLITVLFEDLFEAITIHKDFCGKKEVPQHFISLQNNGNCHELPYSSYKPVFLEKD